MAVIQKIRNKYGKLAGGIIAVALVGFILMDAASGKFGDYFGHDSSAMKINGDKVDQREYQTHLQEYQTLYTMFSQEKGMTDEARARMDEQAVHLLVYEKVAGKICDKLGITTTKDEQKDLIYGANPDPLVQQFKFQGQRVFVNKETGQFDPQYVKAFEQQAAQIDPTGKAMESWETLKGYALRANRLNKFNSMIVGAIYTPRFLADRTVKEQYNMANINFVKIPFTSVADNDVKVTDDDLKAYMQKHQQMFWSDEPNRTIEYVSFDIVPSKDDSTAALAKLDAMKKEFETTKDDEAFIKRSSDDEMAAPMYVNKKTFMSLYADSIMKLSVGTVFGPYMEGGAYKLTKVLDKKELPDSVKCRHILIATKMQGKDMATDTVAKARIDSIVAAIKSGIPFDSLAKLSDDAGSKATHGEYTFPLQQKEGLSKEFSDFIFEGKVGEKKTVKVSNDAYAGYHYIEILEQKGIGPSVKIATVSKQFAASDNTINAAYAKASEFAGKNGTAAQFDEAVKKGNLNKRIAPGVKAQDFSVKGLGPAREIVRWASTAKVGDVSQVFSFTTEGRYIVAKLLAVQPKGLKEITPDIRAMLEARVKTEKKGQIIAKKYAGMNSLDVIAKTANEQVQHADSVRQNGAFIATGGYAPKAVGYIFNDDFKQGTTSPAIVGNDGVFFITVLSKVSMVPDPMQAKQVAMQTMQQLDSQIRGSVGQALQESLTKTADIKYNVNNM
jgi:peptidyl-prolyl cis-trans isomerase D